MIYITGDLHGEQSRFDLIQSQCPITQGDTLLVCGDFGFLFHNTQSEQNFLDTLEQLPFTIAFIDGNHENFPALFSCPEQIWMGGRVHVLRPSVLHLMRGQIFTIEGLRFFTFGGAASIDKDWRAEGQSWWPQEIPSSEEYHEADRNLQACNGQVDYILTHTMPWQIAAISGKTRGIWPDRELMGYFDYLMDKLMYKTWFCGHMHDDCSLPGNIRVLYYDVIPIENQQNSMVNS